MKKRLLKGFTLLELIIVMAIFSLLMVGAMSLIGPVSKIHKHTNAIEKTYSYVDTIQNYLQDSLEYADDIWVYQGSKSEADLADLCFNFKETYYKDILAAKDASNVKKAECTIRLMTILNHDTTIRGVNYPKGQILMQEITFSSDAANLGSGWHYVGDTKVTGSLSDPAQQVNPQFLSDVYNYDYILGGGSFSSTASGNVAVDKTLPANYEAARSGLDFHGLEIGIAVYDNRQNSDGTNHFTDVDDAGRTYREYDPSSLYINANIPLMNIIARDNYINSSYYVYEKEMDNVTENVSSVQTYPGTWYIDPSLDPANVKHHPAEGHTAFEAPATEVSMDVDDNIYIIYALPDEVGLYPTVVTTGT